jgi:hypothetical protein
LKDLSLNILKTAAMFNFWGDFNTRHNFPGRPELFWPAGVFFITGLLLGLKALWNYARHRRHSEEARHELFPPLFVGLWLGLAALPVVISNEGLPHALRAILMIPPVFIFASVGATWIAPRVMKIFPKHLRILALTLFFALCATEAYITYFAVWGNYPDTKPAFAANYVTLAKYLNSLPREVPKYVIVQAGGVLAGGFPVPAQTVMFLTDTYRKEWQDAKNLHYVLPKDAHKIKGGIVFELK